MTKKINSKRTVLAYSLILIGFMNASAFNRNCFSSSPNYYLAGGGDTIKPVISNPDADSNNKVKVQVVSLFTDRTQVTDNIDNPTLIISYGGGTDGVDTRFFGNYILIYNATDQSGNKADTKTYTYVVDDYIPPVIILNTSDTIIWPLNKPYTSIQAGLIDNYYNSSQVSLTRTSNVNPFKPGLYYDEFTAIDGSANIGIKRRYVKITDDFVGIETLNKEPIITVYPNPSAGILNISYNFNTIDNIKIEVYNEIGILIKDLNDFGGQKGIQTIDLGNEAHGLYIVKIRTGEGQITRKVSIVR